MVLLDAASPDDRARAAGALACSGRSTSGMVVQALVAALTFDPAPAVRVAAARSLGRIGGGRATAALVDAERFDLTAEVRVAASRALIAMPPPRPLPRRAIPLAASGPR